jgi:hypothetical protein
MADGTLGPNGASGIQESGHLLSATQLAQAQGQPIGTISTASGVIHVTHVDGREEALTNGSSIYANDMIRTEPDGGVQIRFVDGTEFLLGGNAELTIDNLIYDPSGSGNVMNMLVAGAFVFVSGSIAGAPGEGMQVATPAGSIGIRGTSVAGRLSETEHGLLLALLRDPAGHVGHVVVFNEAGSVDLDQLFEATILRDRQTPPAPPFSLTLEQIQQLFGPILQMDRTLDLQNESYERHTQLDCSRASPSRRAPAPTSPRPRSSPARPRCSIRRISRVTGACAKPARCRSMDPTAITTGSSRAASAMS